MSIENFDEQQVDILDEKSFVASVTVNSSILGSPLTQDQNLLNFKALMVQRLTEAPELKVGVVRSRNPIGRGLQSIASTVIPGDQSAVRSPVRSTIYRAITPGGGEDDRDRNLIGRTIGRRSSALRCPSGFEFGGRFATRGFGNCGRQLFGTLGSGGGGRYGTDVLGVLRREGERVAPGNYNSRAAQIQRNAQIPRVGAANANRFNQGVGQAVTALANPDIKGSLLVRRDGQVLRPTVGADTLATISDNPDMQDSALALAVTDPAAIGGSAVTSLWKSGVKNVIFALPGGSSIRLNRNRPLTSGDKRKLTRRWASTSGTSENQFDYGFKLRKFSEASDGIISYEENFPNIDNPNDIVVVAKNDDEKKTESVRRWVFSTYLADNAPGKADKDTGWREISSSDGEASVSSSKISTVKDAITHLGSNGNPEEIPAEFLEAALSGSKSFRSTRLQPNVTLLERADGKRWYKVSSSGNFGHLGDKIASDINSTLGLNAPSVKFIGTGNRRDYLVAHPENLTTGKTSRQTIEKMNPSDLLRTVVGDWLADTRDRSPSSLVNAGVGSRGRTVAVPTGNAALSGLTPEELKRRRSLVLGDFLTQSTNAAAADRFRLLAEQQKKLLLELYSDLIERARQFSWDDYMSRLGLDGELSDGERAHIEVVKTLFEKRLEQLDSGRQRFLSTMGIS